MNWKEYLQERVNVAPVLAKEHTKDFISERAVVFRMMKFANSFLEGNADSRIIVLYGLRGIGKSTILQELAAHHQQEGCFPTHLASAP